MRPLDVHYTLLVTWWGGRKHHLKSNEFNLGGDEENVAWEQEQPWTRKGVILNERLCTLNSCQVSAASSIIQLCFRWTDKRFETRIKDLHNSPENLPKAKHMMEVTIGPISSLRGCWRVKWFTEVCPLQLCHNVWAVTANTSIRTAVLL